MRWRCEAERRSCWRSDSAAAVNRRRPPRTCLRLTVDIRATDSGRSLGSVVVEDTDDGARFTPSLSGLTAGEHGFHVHVNPDCGMAGAERRRSLRPGEHGASRRTRRERSSWRPAEAGGRRQRRGDGSRSRAARSRERPCRSLADDPCRRRQLLGRARTARGRRRPSGLRGRPGRVDLNGHEIRPRGATASEPD